MGRTRGARHRRAPDRGVGGRSEPFDLGEFTHCGTDPRRKRYVLIQVPPALRAGFEPIAPHIVLCDGDGCTSSDLRLFTYASGGGRSIRSRRLRSSADRKRGGNDAVHGGAVPAPAGHLLPVVLAWPRRPSPAPGPRRPGQPALPYEDLAVDDHGVNVAAGARVHQRLDGIGVDRAAERSRSMRRMSALAPGPAGRVIGGCRNRASRGWRR
jgi:hypothetical protein